MCPTTSVPSQTHRGPAAEGQAHSRSNCADIIVTHSFQWASQCFQLNVILSLLWHVSGGMIPTFSTVVTLHEERRRPLQRVHKTHARTCSLTEARMAEVVSDSEPSPLEVLRTGLNMVAALAVSDATSGTGIPPGRQSGHATVKQLLASDRDGSVAAQLSHLHSPTLVLSYNRTNK